MNVKKSWLVRFCAGVYALSMLGGVIAAEMPPLLPREVVFGNPTRTMLRLSPDGTMFSYLAPSKDKGVLNVWVKTVGQDDERMVTRDTHRGIHVYGWIYDSRHILYLQDKDGDENNHAFLVNLDSGVVRDLTPFQGIRAENFILNKRHPDQLLVGLNLRDRRLFDMYRIDLKTGAVNLDTENPGGVIAWTADQEMVIRAATLMSPTDGSTLIKVRDAVDRPWRDFLLLPFGENGGVVDFSDGGTTILCETSVGFNTTRLVKMDLGSGKVLETIAFDDRCDVGSILQHPDTHAAQAVSFNYLKPRWEVLDDTVAKDFATFRTSFGGSFGVVSRDLEDTKWIIWVDTDDGPLSYYLYERSSGELRFILEDRPELKKYTLAKMKPLVIKARDGLDLVSYLTLPVGLEAKNLPLVLLVHGGPWSRDVWGFDPWAQWLANRGYAVLMVNFRGSAGFGKQFLNAGDLGWGTGAMQHDLTDAVQWAVKKGIADPQKVAIMGGSYGGYATLAGLTFTPDLYCCGVDIVGPSNIKTLFEAIPPYWEPLKQMFIKRVGDVLNDEALNRRISPLYHVDAIRVPLLIGQGQNDPRVNIRESDQIVEAMRARNLEVEYVVYPDEGHGFARPENRLDFYGYVDEFLAENLGGRVEPHRKIEGATGEVR